MSQVPKGEATTLAPISAAYSSLIEKLNRPNIPSLDGIRGIAALLGVFYHFGMFLHFYPLPRFFLCAPLFRSEWFPNFLAAAERGPQNRRPFPPTFLHSPLAQNLPGVLR